MAAPPARKLADPNAPNGTRIGIRWYEVRNPNGNPARANAPNSLAGSWVAG